MSVRHKTRVAATTLLATLLLTACSPTGNFDLVEQQDATLGDAVLSVRLSPQLSGIGAGAKEGYLLLISEDGATEAIEVGYMDTGQLVWAENDKLYFSGPDVEYQLTQSGLTSLPRGSNEQHETSRFLTPDGSGSIAIYNVGFTDDAYLHRVVTTTGEGLHIWDSPGLFTALAQCGDSIVGITQNRELGATTGITVDNSIRSEVLVQLYPESPDPATSVLSVLELPVDSEFEQFFNYAPCVQNTVLFLAFEAPVEQPELRIPVMRTWNVDTGEHHVTPLRDENQNPANLTLDDVMSLQGLVSDNGAHYRWVTLYGKVYSVELSTGVVHELFDLGLTQPNGGQSQFIVTEHAIFVLDVHTERRPMEFSRYDLESGEREVLLHLSDISSIHHQQGTFIRDIALNPAWLKAHDGR